MHFLLRASQQLTRDSHIPRKTTPNPTSLSHTSKNPNKQNKTKNKKPRLLSFPDVVYRVPSRSLVENLFKVDLARGMIVLVVYEFVGGMLTTRGEVTGVIVRSRRICWHIYIAGALLYTSTYSPIDIPHERTRTIGRNSRGSPVDALAQTK